MNNAEFAAELVFLLDDAGVWADLREILSGVVPVEDLDRIEIDAVLGRGEAGKVVSLIGAALEVRRCG